MSSGREWQEHAPVDHETSYTAEVLQLTGGQTEEHIDARLVDEAKEIGIDISGPQCATIHTKPLSTRTFSSEAPRRSGSLNSRASQSTGMTSNFSEMSRDPHDRRRSRASLSFRDYDNFMSRGVPNGRHSMSFSPSMTPSHSTFSLPLYSPEAAPKRHLRVIRGLSILRLHKSDSSVSSFDGCPHCPKDPLSQRRAVHRLSCGHRLCTQALRSTIKSATEAKSGAVPSCCSIPISGDLVEHVMTREEQEILLNKLEQWNGAASRASSAMSDSKRVRTSARPISGGRQSLKETKADPVHPQMQRDLEKMQQRPEYKHLQQEQVDVRERFLAWISRQRTDLEARHERSRKEMRSAHEAATEDLLEHHASALSEAEDKQVKAEADLREQQDQERRDNATALKHMEAYCAGTYSFGEAHHRTITEQDRAELEKTRKIRETMDAKHASSINVLRGEQGRRMKLRMQRQDKEMQELRRQQRKEELELERCCSAEVHRFDGLVEEKKKAMMWRRTLLEKVCLAKLAAEENGAVVGAELALDVLSSEMDGGAVSANVHEATNGNDTACGCEAAIRATKEGLSTGFTVNATTA